MNNTVLRTSCVLMAAACTVAAHAQTRWLVSVGGAPLGANDIHLTFNMSGGLTKKTPVAPAAQNIDMTVNNAIDASFAAVPANFVYQAKFTSAATTVFMSGYWTLNGANIGGITDNYVTLQAVPEPAAVLPLAAGLVFLGRRRRKSA